MPSQWFLNQCKELLEMCNAMKKQTNDADDASPRPWRVVESAGGLKCCISDANGLHVASCFGHPERAESEAQLIVDAVNERESLFADVKVKESELRLKIEAAEKERAEAAMMRDRAKEWHRVGLKENEKLRDKLDASEAERDRLRKEIGRLRYAVKLLDAAAGPYCAPELRPRLLAEARAELAEKAAAEEAEGESHA